MGDPKESTETIVRRHVEKHVACKLKEELDPLKESIKAFEESTTVIVKSCNQQIEQIKEVQDAHQVTLFGKMPPDPSDPGVWRMTEDNTMFIKRVKQFSWKVLLGVATAIGAAIWALI